MRRSLSGKVGEGYQVQVVQNWFLAPFAIQADALVVKVTPHFGQRT
jgi:hypothetical protein